MSEFAIVVVIHNSAGELAVLLDSIERNLDPRPQIVVVDNASSDGGAELARARGAEVVEPGRNLGFGAANNAGIERVQAPVTALLNPDVELLDGGLAQLVAAVDGRDALVAPRLLNGDGSIQRSAHPLPGTAAALLPALVPPLLWPPALRLHADPWRSPRERTVGWAIAAAIVARTDTLRRIGPFDSDAFLFYEDLELCLRARSAGVPTVLRPDIALRHTGSHATDVAFGGEPHLVHAQRRREVVGARLGARALALDDAAQGLTFATRALARRLLRRDATRERAQLKALREARRS